MSQYTHSDLVRIAYRWALGPGGAAVAFKELVTLCPETPDVVGFGGTVNCLLIECKISRADFRADAKKPFRVNPTLGLGSHRIYCAPAGLLSADELPEKWALLEVDARGKCCLTYRRDPAWPQAKFLCSVYQQKYNRDAERTVMLSALRRLQSAGVVEQIHRADLLTA